MADAAVEKPAEAPAPKEDLVIDPTPVAAAAAPASGTAASGKSASDSAAAKKRKKDDASKEEEDEDEEDEEEDEGEDEEDDDEEDEEDEEEESAPGKKSSGKKKKAKTKLSVNDPRYFLDTEAVVDDEDDEDDGDEDEVGVGRADELSEEEDNQVDLREQRKNYLTSLLRQDQDVDENMLQERYRNMIYDDDMPDADVEERTDIKQQSFLPTVRDPKLWMVRCKPGLEQSTAIALLQKFVDREISGDPNPLLIRSATAPAHLKGHIYVEAEKEAHAKAAIAGIRSLFQWSVRLVPINEMVDVLKVPTKEFKITKGAWVRVKRGLYTGDIAAVVDADEARGRVTIKLVPRLDFPHIKKVLEQSKDPTVTVPDKKKGRGKAPPQKFFNIDEVRAMGLKELVERRRDPNNGEMYEYFQGGRYRDGYLHKTVNLKSLDMINVVPTIDELARFQNRGEKDEDEDDLEMLARTRPKRKVQFSKGDNVKVIEGDLKHLMGVVESVEEDTVTIMPKHQDLKDLLSFPTAQLQKHFREGDHVRVIAGRHEGEVGLVLRVDEKVVVLFSDSTQKELKVLAADLQAASEVSTGRLELGNYELHDLVQIDAQGVGVIVRVERESFKVLDSNGTVRSIRLQEMGAKKNTRGVPSQAFDANSAPITINDQVQVLDGKNKGKQGVIKHLFRYFVFIFSREILDNSGIFVERAANVALVGGKGSRLAPAALSDPSRAPLQSPGSLRAQAGPHARLQGGMGGMGGRGGGRGGHGGGGGGGRGRGLPDPWVGKTARVVGGPWKGYVGIIKGTTDAACRIELHTNCKTVIVDKDKVKTIDATQQSVNAGGHGSMRGGVNYAEGSRTPMYDVMRTPMRDSEHTPMNPTTPMREAWDPHQPQTPAHTPGAWDRDESGSGHTPGWDGYGPSHTPGTGYSASGYREHNTPGTGGSHQPHTPNFAETPGSGYGEQRTPHDAPHTSGSGAYSTPHMAFTPGVPPTPAGGAHGEYYGAGGADDKEDWFERDIEVKITTEAAGREHVNKKATLVEARTDSCLVKLANGESISVPKSALEAVIPTRKDRVKVTRGTDRGATGVIMGIDGNDAIVKMDADSDVKILTMGSIARYVGTS